MNDFNGTLIKTMGEEETTRTVTRENYDEDKTRREGRILSTTYPDKQEEEQQPQDDEESTESEGDDMVDLVNAPNPWLPAYGFQLQRHSQFQNMQEELRTNGYSFSFML